MRAPRVNPFRNGLLSPLPLNYYGLKKEPNGVKKVVPDPDLIGQDVWRSKLRKIKKITKEELK